MPWAIDVQRPGFFDSSAFERVENDAPLFRILVRVELRHLAGLLELVRLVHEQRRVTTVVDDQRGALAIGPHQRFHRAPPVFLERLALPGEHRDAARILDRATRLRTTDDDAGRGVVLRREDVARHPAHVGAELGQRLDQDAGLNRHVQAAHDARAGQRLLARVALADRHQAGHFRFRQAELLAAPVGQAQVRDLVRDSARRLRRVVCVRRLLAHCSCHFVFSPLLRTWAGSSTRPGVSSASTGVSSGSGGLKPRPTTPTRSRATLSPPPRRRAPGLSRPDRRAAAGRGRRRILHWPGTARSVSPKTRATRGPSAAGTPAGREAASRRAAPVPPCARTRATSASARAGDGE